MNQTKIKDYAPKARRDFIAAVTERAAYYGLTKKNIEPATVQGDVVLIAGRPFSLDIADKRKKLEERIRKDGFNHVMEAISYTWFNRLVAIRYMEIHGYLEHGYRILSGKGPVASGQQVGTRPEILDHATDVELPGLDRKRVLELKLDGTRDEELYRLLLLAQCNALNTAMPFLFERIGDETELLLPANLLHTDSLIRKLVESIDEDSWQEIEIIGWLYQFYISEKKDQVIGKVVKSEDIPAATQLFTPNWIVKYMVQNSLGAQWLATYPDSPLKGQMDYYIEPAEQTEEVQKQLDEITPDSLDPEKLTLIDPACGSGHILVEAYVLFKAIYLERGYQKRDIPQLILENNLFGLDIDGRAAQLSGFALMMKGRADDRHLFERGIKLNVMALLDSIDFDAERMAKVMKLPDYGLQPEDLRVLKRLFEHATTFGSLIQVPAELTEKLPALKQLSSEPSHDLFVVEALECLGMMVRQAEMLAAQYDAVVANPPYMGSKYQTPVLKKYLKSDYDGYEKDFFSAFFVRNLALAKPSGGLGTVAPFVWMFISSYERLRERLIGDTSLTSLIQLEYNAFEPAMIPVATFTLMRQHVPSFTGSYVNLSEFKGHKNQAPRTLEAITNSDCGWLFRAKQDEFRKIPGSPVAYWVSEKLKSAFAAGRSIESIAPVRQGFQTGDNDRFLRLWFEVDQVLNGIGFASTEEFHQARNRYAPYNKGGDFRKWFGNNEYVVAFDSDSYSLLGDLGNKLPSRHLYFKSSLTWSSLSSGSFGARHNGIGFTFSAKGACAFPQDSQSSSLALGLLNSHVCAKVLEFFSPTLDFNVGSIRQIPLPSGLSASRRDAISANCERGVAMGRHDWDAYERSWDFQSLRILTVASDPTPTLESSYTAWITKNRDTIAEMKSLEEENNRIFIDAYGLQDELTPDVPIEQITLTVNPAYRYGGKLSEQERWTRFREDTMEELVSYSIGCMMGRYSLDETGSHLRPQRQRGLSIRVNTLCRFPG